MHAVIAGGYDTRVVENVEYYNELVELSQKLQVSVRLSFDSCRLLSSMLSTNGILIFILKRYLALRMGTTMCKTNEGCPLFKVP